jgi:hypothetical protein
LKIPTDTLPVSTKSYFKGRARKLGGFMKTGKQWEVVTPIESPYVSGKTYWQRLGTAWEHVSDSGNGKVFISLKLNAVPINGTLMLFPRGEQTTAPGPVKTGPPQNNLPDNDVPPHEDEDAPFFGSASIYEE